MGVNFKTFLDSLRFDLARKLLLSSDQTVSKICETSGFEDVPNFIKRFKKHYGVTPTELRRSGRSAAKVS
jgi:AraC-like DNA-binding protein